jgi:hypothetical protein
MLTRPYQFTNRYGTRFVVVPYVPNFDEAYLEDQEVGPYDCFVLNRRNTLPKDVAMAIATKLAEPRFEWCEVFGFGAELLHDAVDDVAVVTGRQTEIGAGNPMTTWDAETTELRELLSYILTGGQGTCDWKLVLVIGTEDQVQEIITGLAALSPSHGDE